MAQISLSRRAMIGAGLTAALSRPSHAQAGKAVVAVYAGQDVQLWDRVVVQPYNKTSAVKAEVYEAAMPSVSIAQSQGKPPFNAALVSASQAYDLHLKGMLHELQESDIPAIGAIPRKLWPTTKNGTILGMPVHFSLYVIAYNTELAKASDFQSWNALIDRKWKDQVSLTRPAILARSDLTLFSKIYGGPEGNLQAGYDFISKLAGNALNVYSSMASLMSQLGRGEVVAAPFFHDEIVHLHHQGVKNIDFVIPREGALVIPYMISIPKGAQDIEAAKPFLNALADPKYQIPFLNESGLLPTNPTVPMPPDLVGSLGSSAEEIIAKNVTADWTAVAAEAEPRTRRMEELVSKAK